ncbi:helix-turn-helix domain-containing protein [Mesorhizobium sp.]|uniref:helix-turn-helix domain-containing protein n=1 Tax=Mesorhizobium sp. TaxID=1871066 RepID=UPI00345C8E8A
MSRCLALLEFLAGEREHIELSELGSGLNMPVSAAHRLVTTLANLGWAPQANSMRCRLK